MAENNDTDDIDDFFAAADSADSAALRRAADNFSIPSADAADADSDLTEDDFLRYIAVDVDENGESGAPFKVVPVHIPSALPWWAWAAMSFILVGLFFIIVFLPAMRLNQKTARLTDGNYARAQSAMRDLILTGDDRTVDRLYEIASSAAAPMESRLRAVDALAVMREAAADRALLRLEIAGRTDELIRHAAINARRQRRASARGSRDD